MEKHMPVSIHQYEYPKCSTCRKARKFLDQRGLTYLSTDITKQPPTREELQRALESVGNNVRRLFNTSGQDYRAMGLKERVDSLAVDEVFDLLESNGKLIRRPFLVTPEVVLVGFKEDVWGAELEGS